MKKPGILVGALVGFLITLPTLAVFYIGNQIAGFPFVPFSVFDSVRDLTPGGVIAFTIQTMVNVIRGLHLGPTDSTAKLAEQSMAILMILVITIIAGAVFFAVMRRIAHRQEWLPGVVLGLVVGIPLTVLSVTVNHTFSADHTTSAVWVIGVFLLWGYAINWAYNRLTATATISASTNVPGESIVSAQAIDRRQFLITLGGATAAITVVGAFVGSLAGENNAVQTVSLGASSTEVPQVNLPNANAALMPAPGTRPELTSPGNFYRIDISLVPPNIDLATWTLPWVVTAADGTVNKIAEMTMDDIRKFTPMEQYITQGCISNPIGGDLISTIKWSGASMQDVLKQVKLPADASHLLITGADGFYETVALDLINKDPSIMLGYDFADQPLPVPHGFPLRIHVPNLYGMKQPKWITKIEVLNHDSDGYWVERGWDKVAAVQAVSVIDTVATNNVVTTNGQKLVPVGGIAWAGTRGISKVEVQVDNGAWVAARLRDPLSKKTWVIWRYDWPFASGSHTFAVRCYDGSGTMQVTQQASEAPSGATGIDQVQVTV